MDQQIIDYKANQIYSVLRSTSLAVHYDCAINHHITIDPGNIRRSLLQIEDLVKTVHGKWGPMDLNEKQLEFLDVDTHYKLQIDVKGISITSKLAKDGQHLLVVPESADVDNNSCFYVSGTRVKKAEKGAGYFVCINNDTDGGEITKIKKDIPGIELYRVFTVSEKMKQYLNL